MSLWRLPLVLGALRQAAALSRHDGWTPAELAAYQSERLDALVAHARAHSPFHRERLAHLPLGSVALSALPTMDKTTMMARFDDAVTDRRLRREGVERHLDGPEVDRPYLGGYEVMSTGGSSGERGLFVYGREDLRHALAGVLRVNSSMHGLAPRLPRRKVAIVMAKSATHMTARFGAALDVGVHRFLRLDARTPVPELVRALNAFQPGVLTAYASMAALLAEEQIEGRLRISPGTVQTTSEVRTQRMTECIREAFGCHPFDVYASTETCMLGAECEEHRGLHVLTDQVLVEVVDADNRPVAPGSQGARLLITNLENRTQPIIRYELTDLVTLSPEPCPCGRPFPLIAELDGRTDDVLSLSGAGGGRVQVHPLTLRSPLGSLRAIRQYRLLHHDEGITVEVVTAEPTPELAGEIRRRLAAALEAQSVDPPPLEVEFVSEIERHRVSGKVRLVESRLGSGGKPSAPPVHVRIGERAADPRAIFLERS